MSNTLFEKLKKFVDLNREEKSRPGAQFYGTQYCEGGHAGMEN